MSPDWPPLEITLSCGLAPTVAHLRRTICTALSNTSTEKNTSGEKNVSTEKVNSSKEKSNKFVEKTNISIEKINNSVEKINLSIEKTVLYKYNLQSCSWFQLKTGMRVEGKNDGKNEYGKNKAVILKNKVENIFEAPYNLQEGDLICAFELPTQEELRVSLSNYMHNKNIDNKNDGNINNENESKIKIVEKNIDINNENKDNKTELNNLIPIKSLLNDLLPNDYLSNELFTAVSRPEDRYLKALKQQGKIDKKLGVGGERGSERGGERGVYRSNRHSKEIMLSLGGDLDFSDDSDGGGYEG